MTTASEELSALACPKCGEKMESGYILGKHIRLRWSPSPKGMTVFAGTPLTSLPRRYFFSRHFLLEHPNLEAARCEKCGMGIFLFDSQPNHPRSAKRAAFYSIFGYLCFLLGLAVFLAMLEKPSVVSLPVALLLPISMLVFGVMLLLLIKETV